jgi:hypothetical protein
MMERNNYRLLTTFLMVLLLSATTMAENVVLSDWVKNISEGEGESAPGYEEKNPRMVVDGNNIHMVWVADSAYSKKFIYYRRSTDLGTTWGEKKRVFTKARNDVNFEANEWQLAVSGDNVHILVSGRGWGDSWYGTLHHIRSTNGGQSFEEPEEIVTAGEAYHVTDIFTHCEGDLLTIGYRIQYNAAVDNTYYIKKSSNNGDTFQDKVVYSTESGSDWNIWDVLVDGENIYVLYSEQYYMYGLQRRELYLRASNDGGDTFKKTTLSFPSADGEHKAMNLQDEHYLPKIASHGDDLFVVFCAYNENDEKHIYLAHSADKGQNFNEPRNLTEGKMPEGYDILEAHETISVKDKYVNIVFLCDNNALFTIHSDNSGEYFEDPKLLLDEDSYLIGEGAWPSIISGKDNDEFYVFYSWPCLTYSNDGGRNFSIPVMMSPHFSTSGQIGQNYKSPQMQIDNNGNIHMAFYGYFLYSADFDYDIFYRKYVTDPVVRNPGNNQALNIDYNKDNKIYDNMQIIQKTIDMSNSFTIEICIRPAAECPEKTKIVSKDMYSGFILGTNYYEPYFEFETKNNGTYKLEANNEISNQVWTHLAVTYDKDSETNNVRLYVNGNLADSADVSGSLNAEDGYLILGNTKSGGLFSGLFDEFRIWKRALAKNEIQAKIGVELTGQESDLEAYFDFNGSYKDKTGNGNHGVLMYKESLVNSDLSFTATQDEIPAITKFSLDQNYPNPFNPITTIQYSVSKDSYVSLGIYDLQGRLVQNLVDGFQKIGSHQVQWEAYNFPSGVYFYRIKTGNFTAVKKCILMK